ncbi:MAG: sigma-54 dependent transcriptional regulator [Myxococcota bacterium]
MAHTILVVDDEKNILTTLSRALQLEGFHTLTAGSAEQGLAVAGEKAVDLVMLDVKLPGMDGIAALAALKKQKPELPVIMMSGHATVDTAVQATKLGAENFVEKPISQDRLLPIIRNLLRLKDTLEENQELRQAVGKTRVLLGDSPAMHELMAKVEQVAPTQARVLILGENGTGKELVAHAIHERSRRASKPFVKLNCAAVPAELIESELFGHEKGAFTGAHGQRKGRFEVADGGTLLLDEIGDMPMAMQAKVLRVLQEGELERVGGTETIKVDVRVLAATNKDLEREIEREKFREDLLYRLNVVTLRVPALRERSGDIPVLARHFMADAARRNDMRPKTYTDEALQLLQSHRFPGNVRELRNLVERLCILGTGEQVTADDVRDALPALSTGETPGTATPGTPDGSGKGAAPLYRSGAAFSQMVEDAERQILLAALQAHEGNMTATAAALGLERSHLYKKMKSLGIR